MPHNTYEEIEFKDDGYRIYAYKNGEELGVVTEYKHSDYGHLFEAYKKSIVAQQNQELLEKVEKMRKEVKIVSSNTGKKDGHVDFEALAYNKVIDDVLALIQNKPEEK